MDLEMDRQFCPSPPRTPSRSGPRVSHLPIRHLPLALIVLLAAALRMIRLDVTPPGLWFDEARTLIHTAALLEQGHYETHYFDSEPFHILFVLAGCALAGITPLGLRLGSAMVGVLTVPVCYWFAAPLWGRKRALVACFLLAILPWHILMSRIGFRAVTLPLATLLSAGAFDRAMRKRSGAAVWQSAFFLGAGMYSYIPFPLMLPVLSLYGFCVVLRRRRVLPEKLPGENRLTRKLVACAILLFTLTLIPAALIAWSRGSLWHVRLSQEQVFHPGMASPAEGPISNLLRVAGMFVFSGDPNPRHNIPGTAQIPRALFPFMLVGACHLLKRLYLPRNVLLLSLFAAFLLPSVLSSGAPHAMRTAGALPPVCIILAIGAVRGITWTGKILRLNRRLWRRTAFALAASALAASSAYEYFVLFARDPKVWKAFQALPSEVAREVNRLPRGTIVLHEPIHDGALAFQFLTRHAHAKIVTVNTPEDYSRFARSRESIYVFFIEKEKHGKAFFASFPKAVRTRIFTNPEGQPVGVMFLAKEGSGRPAESLWQP